MGIISFLRSENYKMNDKIKQLNNKISSLENGQLPYFHSKSLKTRWFLTAIIVLGIHPLTLSGILPISILVYLSTSIVAASGMLTFVSNMIADRADRNKKISNKDLCMEEYKCFLKKWRNQDMIELIENVNESDLDVSDNYLNRFELQVKLRRQEQTIENLLSKFTLLSNVTSLQALDDKKYTKNLKIGFLASLAISLVSSGYFLVTGAVGLVQFINYFVISFGVNILPDLAITSKVISDKEKSLDELKKNMKCKYDPKKDYSNQFDYVKDKLSTICIEYEKNTIRYNNILREDQKQRQKQKEKERAYANSFVNNMNDDNYEEYTGTYGGKRK